MFSARRDIHGIQVSESEVLIVGGYNSTNSRETYRLNLVTNECVRDTETVQGVCCYCTLSPVLAEEVAYFVGNDRSIHIYKIAEKKWEIV